MSGMCADRIKDDLLGLLSGLADTSKYEQIVFYFSGQLLRPPEDPAVLLPYIRATEVILKTLDEAVETSEFSRISGLTHEEQLEEAQKYPDILHKKILRVATSTAVSLLYETAFSFAGGNQVVLIFGLSLVISSGLFPLVVPAITMRDPKNIRTQSVHLPITAGIKEWPITFRRFDTDQVSVRRLAPNDPIRLALPWTSAIPISEVLVECRNIFSATHPISYPVEDVSKNPRALLVQGGHNGFLLAIPRPSNMKNFSITLRTGKGIQKETGSAESNGKAPTVERNWMIRKEVAEAIGKSTDTVDNYCRDGVLESHKVGREVRISAESVQRYLAKS